MGLDSNPPKVATDQKCPFAGNASIHGRISSGLVIKTKMQRTTVTCRDYLHRI